MSTELNWADESCTLPTAEQPLRMAEFTDLFAAALSGVERVSPTRLRLTLDGRAKAETVRLADAESSCCSFFTFTFGESEAGRFPLDVDVPANQTGVLDGLAVHAETART